MLEGWWIDNRKISLGDLLLEIGKLIKAYEDGVWIEKQKDEGLYSIVSNRFTDNKKLVNVLEKIGNEFIDDSNYDIQLERCQNYFRELFPIFNKIMKIDNVLDDDGIDHIFDGFHALYHTIKIWPIRA